MSKRYVGFVVMGFVVGLLAGAGGLYLAQSRGLAPDGGGSDTGNWSVAHLRDAADGHYPQEQTGCEDDGHGHTAHDEEEQHAHDDTEHGEEHGPIRLSAEAIDEAGIEIVEATGGELQRAISLPGEIVLNPDKLAHIVPRVGGIVRDVYKTIGDSVQSGEVMAVLESRELAEAKAEHLAGKQRLSLAQANLAASEELKAKGIVPGLEFLAAQRDLAEAEIGLRAAEFRLHTLGVTEEELAGIKQQADSEFSFHELRAPFSGTVIAKHITLGEVVTTETDVFQLADLTDVWVHLTVYQSGLSSIRTGQSVTITARDGVGEASAPITYLSPVVDEATRTAVARVVLSNPDGRWRPGLFVTGRVQAGSTQVPLRVPKTALLNIEGQTCVFVATGEGFEPRAVELDSANDTHVEVVAGLHPGERYVARGAFILKAELGKESFGDGHAH